MRTIEVQETRELREAPAMAPACGTCGETAAPSGACLNVGACTRADSIATRGAAGATSKFAVPAAWNASGRVD
jgi:hypothetical protein